MNAKEEAPRLLDRVRNEIRLRHYSIRTEQTYTHWIVRFVRFHGLRHPRDMGAPKINAFLTRLAVHDNVTAATQNQALSALVFLYRHVLRRDPGNFGEIVRAKRPQRLPVILISPTSPSRTSPGPGWPTSLPYCATVSTGSATWMSPSTW
jgi:hypothetical protein